MFYLDSFEEDHAAEHQNGFHYLSAANDWVSWISACIPNDLDATVRGRLKSNLKHTIVGLEMKAGLIVPHGERQAGNSTLFEPYFQVLTFEFCVGVFSVCEGLGSALHLSSQNDDGLSGRRVPSDCWKTALYNQFDPDGNNNLGKKISDTTNVRNKMHQDQIGRREDIDWHDLGYDNAFLPAKAALQTLLLQHSDKVPEKTNLKR